MFRNHTPSVYDDLYKVNHMDGLTLTKALECLREAAPFESRREALDALRSSSWLGIYWADGWILELVLKDNRTLRFDWAHEIAKLPRDMDPQEAWQLITKGAYERSKKARLAFDLQWIAHAESREYPVRHWGPRHKDAPVAREVAVDGPKRRRFKLRDREMGPAHHRWRCKCYHCRTRRLGGARPTREARAIKEAMS